MLMEKVPMTAPGLKTLEDELKQLKSVERPSIIKAIAAAREHGDISENAEYTAARERQSFIEGRIAEVEDIISRAEVIDVSKLSGDTVTFGVTAFSARVTRLTHPPQCIPVIVRTCCMVVRSSRSQLIEASYSGALGRGRAIHSAGPFSPRQSRWTARRFHPN